MILSVFSGAGGMDVAAHALGLQTYGVEIDAALAAIAQAAGHTVEVRDVRTIDGRTLPAWLVDAIQGGPPCQTFPDDHPWHATPTLGKRYLGIGNAGPPVLWMAVLRALGAHDERGPRS